MLEEFNHLLGADAFLKHLKIEIPDSQAGDDGERLPIKVELQHRRLAAWCPGPAPVGTLTQSAFVEEDDRAAFCLRFFLRAGQRFFFQSSIRASFRSSARPTGCCMLQPNWRRMRQTWPRWYSTWKFFSLKWATRSQVHKGVS